MSGGCSVIDVLDFYLSVLGVIAMIVGFGSIVFYPRQTLEACNIALAVVDRAIKRWAE